MVGYVTISSLPKISVLSFILCFAKENLLFLVTFVNSNYLIFTMNIAFFFLYVYYLSVGFGFSYFHSVKIQFNYYLYVKSVVFQYMLILTQLNVLYGYNRNNF